MQILGLSESTPKPENRAKSLLWPSIRNETDVDHVTRQGFWICLIVAILTTLIALSQPWLMFGAMCFSAVFFFMSGIGVRMRSVTAAACAFLAYAADTAIAGFSVPRWIIAALLLANLRGTWLSARWRSTQTEPPPIPMNITLADKLVDHLPMKIWPFGRFVYYVLAAIEIILSALGLASRVH